MEKKEKKQFSWNVTITILCVGITRQRSHRQISFEVAFRDTFLINKILLTLADFMIKWKKCQYFWPFLSPKLKTLPGIFTCVSCRRKKIQLKCEFMLLKEGKKKCWPNIFTICEWVELFNRFQKWCRLPKKDRFKSGGWFTFNHCYQFLTINCNFFYHHPTLTIKKPTNDSTKTVTRETVKKNRIKRWPQLII